MVAPHTGRNAMATTAITYHNRDNDGIAAVRLYVAQYNYRRYTDTNVTTCGASDAPTLAVSELVPSPMALTSVGYASGAQR